MTSHKQQQSSEDNGTIFTKCWGKITVNLKFYRVELSFTSEDHSNKTFSSKGLREFIRHRHSLKELFKDIYQKRKFNSE